MVPQISVPNIFETISSLLLSIARPGPEEGIGGGEQNGYSPANQIEPFEYFLLGNEGNHENGVQVQPFAEHPKIIAHQKVVQKDVQCLTVELCG